MTRTVFILCCLLCLTFAHNKEKEQNYQIYKPFADVPKPQNNQPVPEIVEVESQKKVHDHENLSEQEQQQYEQFNETLEYGLIAGTMLLACMLMKTCVVKGKRNRVTQVIAQPQPNTMRSPMLNKAVSEQQIRNRIQWHKCEIKKLEQESRMLQEAEYRMIEEKQIEKRRAEETLRAYYQVEMGEPRVYYGNNFVSPPQPFHTYEQVPIGRPLPRDQDSSFVSEYPTI